jgi:deazaflavin-dependent oxidoreductase (nitroreductase family)
MLANPIKPNAIQRAFHCILMMRPVTLILIRILRRADMLIWKLNGGRFSLTSALAGLPTFKVTTIGVRSKQPRTVPLVGLVDGDRIALIASNFGQAHNPAWYYNLKANPQCKVRVDGIEKPFIARETEGREREYYLGMAVSYYAGYAAYQARAGSRRIPVLVLESPKQLPES